MKKTLSTFAVLLFLLIGLVACSSSETKGGSAVFEYNGKQVSQEDLETYKEEYLSHLPEYKKLTQEEVVTHYVLKNELVNYVGLTDEEVDAKYEKILEVKTEEGVGKISRGELTLNMIREMYAQKYLATSEEKVQEIYEKLSDDEKSSLPIEVFKESYYYVYQAATYYKVVDTLPLQKELLEKSKVKDVEFVDLTDDLKII